ncbi:hypothetical protein [Cellulomonas marina]|uniref:Uncharacterized protein n=1 Tax=Cellulomonas marina TaxID=988821 RepID=A0A1I0WSQ7_9CELL|nr:hypothetical protein [Cellulomonas marina]GIG27842.1 hypothetical protein Cma02nite_04420 [Cellulomonas marina]SFA91457.1 hypothetical protein SAMN05421867_103191 [Cellulomonas marina]
MSRRRPVDPTAPERRPLLGGGAFGLFGEVLVVGLGVSVLSLPVVTLLPAMAAGVAHVRRHLGDEPDAVADLGRLFLRAVRGVWAVALGVTVLLGLLWVDLRLAASGAVPGGAAVLAVSALVAVALLVVLLRAAGAWRDGERWADVLRAGARRAGDDLTGSALLVLALAMCALFTWMLAPLAVLVPGLLALAVVAVEHRRAARS